MGEWIAACRLFLRAAIREIPVEKFVDLVGRPRDRAKGEMSRALAGRLVARIRDRRLI
jgi:hypothetical protein